MEGVITFLLPNGVAILKSWDPPSEENDSPLIAAILLL